MTNPTSQPERLYRPRPPSEFESGVTAWLDPKTNVVTYNNEEWDLHISRDLRMLRGMDEVETYFFKP